MGQRKAMTPTEWKEAQLAQPDMWESILGAVARGWCYEENANKTMDSELAVAIAKEVHALYTTPPYVATLRPQRTWVEPREWRGLTDEDYRELHLEMGPTYFYQDYGRAIEAKLKEKNNVSR